MFQGVSLGCLKPCVLEVCVWSEGSVKCTKLSVCRESSYMMESGPTRPPAAAAAAAAAAVEVVVGGT